MNNRLPLSLAALVALAPVAAAQYAEFDAPWYAWDAFAYPNGVGASASAVADFDGDGAPDLAVVSWPANAQLSILFGDGRSGFRDRALYPLLDGSLGVVAADLDGDGDPDLAVTITGRQWDGSQISVFRNRGDGTFTVSGPYAAGNGPTGITAADFDGDGDLDLAVAHDRYITSGNSFALLLNNGGGAFGPPAIRTLPSSSFRAVAGDLNGDGRPDLVVAGEKHDLSVMLNTGSGLGPAVSYLAMPVLYLDTFPTLELADVDRDGDVDVLYSASQAGSGPGQGSTGLVGLLRNPGAGAFGAVETIPLVPGQDAAVGLGVGDLTGDGWPDLVAAQGGLGFWSLVPGDGAGGFGAARAHRVGESPVDVQPVDTDGDGDLEVLAVASGSLSVSVHVNPGNGTFAAASFQDLVSPSISPCFFSRTSSSDLDGDGDVDLAVGYGSFFSNVWGVSIGLNQGDGTFATTSYSAPVWAETLALGDLNRDGFDDVAWMDDGFPTRLRFRLNRGDGTFGPMVAGPSLPCDVDQLILGDVDGDGDADALVVGCFAEVSIARYDSGFGAFARHPLSNTATTIAGGDLDRDGDLDLVTNSAVQGWVEVSLNNGNGTFQAAVPFQSGFAVKAITIADLDGDGVNDVATADGNARTMSVMIGRGNGLLKPPVSYTAVNSVLYDNYHSIVSGDADGDGDVDLWIANYGSQDVSQWRNRGDGTFEPHRRLGVGERAWDVEVADFTGDAVPDLVVLVEKVQGRWFYPAVALVRGTGADPWTDLGQALAGTLGPPALQPRAVMQPALPFVLRVNGALPGSPGILVLGGAVAQLPFLGGVLVPRPDVAVPVTIDPSGAAALRLTWPAGVPGGLQLVAQAWLLDPGAVQGAAATNGVSGLTPN